MPASRIAISRSFSLGKTVGDKDKEVLGLTSGTLKDAICSPKDSFNLTSGKT
jgi:hypothetical protein